MATPIYYPPTQNGLQKVLDAELLTGVTASATLSNTTGIQNKKGVMVIDRIDSNNNLTPNKREYISFDGTSGSTVVTLVRGLAGSTDQDHSVGAVVEFVSDITQQQAIIDGLLLVVDTDGNLNKASGAEINTGTEDGKIVTPKAIADSNLLSSTERPETGWIAAGEAWTYAAADDPTYTFTVASDVRTKYSAGMRVRFTQSQALTSKWNLVSDVNDSVGSNNGTATDITYTSGALGGNSATFNGSTSKIVITDAANLKPTGNFSVGCWMKSAANGDRIFQSWSQNTNTAGFGLWTSGNKFSLISAKNTGTTAGTDYIQVVGNTAVVDNAWHFVVATWNGSFIKLYVDGKLDGSGYWPNAPAYAATNYVRVGCQNNTGSDTTFYNGQISDLFLINGYALGETNIKALYDANTAVTSPLTLTKHGMISKDPTYSAPNSTVTIFGGQDYDLANATISSPFYSTQNVPQGFPKDPSKWSVESNSLTGASQANPTQNVWYNVGSNQLSIPIGSWNVGATGWMRAYKASATEVQVFATLSNANNSESDKDFTIYREQTQTNAGDSRAIVNATPSKNLVLNSKTTYYLNLKTGTASANSLDVTVNTSVPTIIRAVCAYL